MKVSYRHFCHPCPLAVLELERLPTEARGAAARSCAELMRAACNKLGNLFVCGSGSGAEVSCVNGADCEFFWPGLVRLRRGQEFVRKVHRGVR